MGDMTEKISPDQCTAIENERAALMVLMDEMSRVKDDDEREELGDAIKAQAEKLQKMCEDLQAQADALAQEKPKDNLTDAVVEVVLTPEQRARVLEKTGIDVPSVKIPDPTSELTNNMAFVKPEFIEQRAIMQAENFKRLIETMPETEDGSEVTE